MSNQHREFTTAFVSAVQKIVNRLISMPLTGTVVSYSAGVDLVVRIAEVPDEEILLTFSEGNLLVLDGHSLAAGDNVILLPVSTKYLVLELSSTI